jgi:hypothetical protein
LWLSDDDDYGTYDSDDELEPIDAKVVLLSALRPKLVLAPFLQAFYLNC